jgi:crotonobetainyl-CoA:carnitine CoA-transferase CaiB-like acyl-CoA transferase
MLVSRPFEGIRVIDATHVLAGPFATYQLAVLGADVIKIDDPNEPDMSRNGGTDEALARIGMGTTFLTQASNKRAIALDLKTERDRGTLRELVATADVFVENFRPGAFDALGLGYDDLTAINERLIYASFSAYGNTGARRDQTAYDPVIQATCGLMAATGTAEVSPLKAGSPVIDYATGLCGAFAIASALFQRTSTGKAQRIDMAMLDVALILMSAQITGFSVNGVHPAPNGNKSRPLATSPSPANNTYETKSGVLMVCAANPRQERRLWMALGRDEFLHDDGSSCDEKERRAIDALTEIFLTRTADEWEQFFQQHGVPAARVRSMADALLDPHVRTRRVLTEQRAEGVEGTFMVPVAGFEFEHDGPRVTTPPPTVGQHTDEILRELRGAASISDVH